MYKTNINNNILNEYLDFLIKQSLVEKRIITKERTVFSITQRGRTILNYFGELTQVLHIIDVPKKIKNY